MRSEAHLARAFSHRRALDNSGPVGNVSLLRILVAILVDESKARSGNALIFANYLSHTTREIRSYRKVVFHQHLYHRSLLRSVDDSLKASELLPNLWTNPSRAAEAFWELGRFAQASECFKMAANAASSDDVKAQLFLRADEASEMCRLNSLPAFS
jgi:hypothetical protein